MRALAVLGLVFLYAQSRPDAAGSTTSFTLSDQGGILIAVMLNGAGPFTLALDTGSTHSAIAADVADLIGAPAVARAMVTSTAGNRMRTVVCVQRMAMGPVVTSADPTVIPRDALAEPSSGPGSTHAAVIDVRTGTLRRITSERGQTWVRSWSPDGTS